MANPNPANLGHKVSTRELNWADLCHRAWGSEFFAPDHAVYTFSNGRQYDSTDKGLTGIYGVVATDPLEFDSHSANRYRDMDSSLTTSQEPQDPLHID